MNNPPRRGAPSSSGGPGTAGICAAGIGSYRRLLGLMLLLSGLMAAAALASGWERCPSWTVGRGVIIAPQTDAQRSLGPYLRISLRNVGRPGRLPVTIYGRWRQRRNSTPAPRKRRLSSISPGGLAADKLATAAGLGSGMKPLGRYRREVDLVSTAILEIPLQALGKPQREVTGLELVVMTANHVTGRGIVTLAGRFP